MAAVRNMREKARVLRSASRIQDLGLFSDLNLDDAPTHLHRAVDKFLDDHKTTVIEAMAQDAAFVFARYFAMTPPFGPGSKQREFPDAFVVEALLDWSNDHDDELLVVSADAPFRDVCQESQSITPFEKLSDLLDSVASDDAALTLFLRKQIQGHLDSIKNTAKDDFECLGFYVLDECGDAELEITKMDPVSDPDLIDISETEVTAELRFDAQYEAFLTYDDSSTGIYDSEEGERLFMDHVTETVHGSAQLLVTVTGTFAGTDADGFDIRDVGLTEPSEGFGILTSEMADYPWK